MEYVIIMFVMLLTLVASIVSLEGNDNKIISGVSFIWVGVVMACGFLCICVLIHRQFNPTTPDKPKYEQIQEPVYKRVN